MSSFFFSSQGKNLLVYLILLFLSFFLIFSSKSKVVLSIKVANETVFYPLRVVTRFTVHEISSFFQLFSKHNNKEGEINAYKNEIIQYQRKIINLQDLKYENEELRNNLNLKSRNQFDATLAEVIGVDPNYTFSYITLNKGRVDGMEKNLPVVTFINGEEALVGIISEAAVFTSTVETVRSNSLDIGISLKDSSIQGVAEGIGGNEDLMQLLFIGKENALELGRPLITSQLSSLFPPDILVGTVVSIDTSNKTRISYQAYIKPTVDVSNLSQVFILKVKPNSTSNNEGKR